MGDQLARGDEYVKKAEKKLNSWSFLGSKHEDAADLFDKAANCFKLSKACTSPSSFISSVWFIFPQFVVEVMSSYVECCPWGFGAIELASSGSVNFDSW